MSGGLHFRKTISSDDLRATGDSEYIYRCGPCLFPGYGPVRFAHGLVGPAGLEAMEDRKDLTGIARNTTTDAPTTSTTSLPIATTTPTSTTPTTPDTIPDTTPETVPDYD